MAGKALIAGVGMIPFARPGASESYDVMGEKAVRAALGDASLSYGKIQQAYVGYVYGDSPCGQLALYGAGQTAIPIVNVNNACASGSTALFLARQAVESGLVDCALALGFEQMQPGMLRSAYPDRKISLQRHWETTVRLQGFDERAPPNAQQFGGAGKEYSDKYGTRPETFGKIAEKSRRHAANNPYAIFRDPLTLDEIMGSKVMHGLLTRLQCCPPACGAAAAVIVSPAFAARHGIAGVEITGQVMTTDETGLFEGSSMMRIVGYDMSRAAARKLYEQTGVGPEDIQVVELHDCFTVNELISYEALDLTPEGTGERFVWDGDNSYGGRFVVNPSGGLLSKGHPLGATGLAQCAELVWQLRGQAGPRQVAGLRHALQHNIGLGGACVVTMYGRA